MSDFATMITRLADVYGGRLQLAEHIGVSREAVRAWCTGAAVPYVRTLVDLSKRCHLALDDVLELAGKPKMAEIKELLIADAEDTLAMRLCRLRDERGFDTVEAAAFVGVYDRATFSRLANGSASVPSIAAAVHIGRALGLAPCKVLVASGLDPDQRMVQRALASTTGLAGWLNEQLHEAGWDAYANGQRRLIAAELGLRREHLSAILQGTRQGLSLREAQAFAGYLNLPLADVLCQAGWDRDLADDVAIGVRAAKHRRREHETVGSLLRAYRVTAGLSMNEVSQHLQIHRTTLLRYETTDRSVPVPVLVELSELLQCPLSRLLKASPLAA